MNIFNLIFYQPLLNALVLLYQWFPGQSFGLAVILLTILIKLILHPLNVRGLKSQKALSELEPRLREIREKFKNDRETMTRETMALYQKAKINPFSGIFLLLIQLPVLIALYRVFSQSISEINSNLLYSFVLAPGSISPYFFNLDLSKASIFLAASAAILQFVQTKFFSFQSKTQSKPTSKELAQFSNIMQKQMIYFFPVLTFLILFRIPSAISLYLAVSIFLSILETFYINRKPKTINLKP